MTTEFDPGGGRVFPMLAGVRGGAHISQCQRYRLALWREWGEDDGPPGALWIGMNPSTATADLDDPTIRREGGFTRRMGFRRYVKANVMDYRASFPKALLAPGVCPCSSDNLPTIRREAEVAQIIVLAYGTLPPRLAHYAHQVVDTLRQDGMELWAVGLTKNGSPRHPLYVPSDAPIIRFG
jgi:hypothetical protein